MKSSYIQLFFAGGAVGNLFYAAVRFYFPEQEGSKKTSFLSKVFICRSCGSRTGLIALIPVIGYIFLLGRCRKCRGRIPFMLPVIQTITGLALPKVYSVFGFNIYALCIFIILCLAVTITAIDIKTFTIPDPLVILFFLLSIYPVIFSSSIKESLLGLLLFSLFFIVIMFMFPGSFGGGDLKYAAAIGFFLGLEYSIVALETALVTGTVTGVLFIAWTGKGLKSRIPFGPFLSVGLIFALFYGREIILFYLNTFF